MKDFIKKLWVIIFLLIFSYTIGAFVRFGFFSLFVNNKSFSPVLFLVMNSLPNFIYYFISGVLLYIMLSGNRRNYWVLLFCILEIFIRLKTTKFYFVTYDIGHLIDRYTPFLMIFIGSFLGVKSFYWLRRKIEKMSVLIHSNPIRRKAG